MKTRRGLELGGLYLGRSDARSAVGGRGGGGECGLGAEGEVSGEGAKKQLWRDAAVVVVVVSCMKWRKPRSMAGGLCSMASLHVVASDFLGR